MLPKYKDIVDLLKKGSTLEAQEKIMSLREGALELQEENQELKNKIRELEEKLKAKEDWESEKEKYKLVNPWKGPGQVYALIKEKADSEEAHYLCTNCFHGKRKVILNPSKRNMYVVMTCPVCDSSVETGYKGIGAPEYVEDLNNKG